MAYPQANLELRVLAEKYKQEGDLAYKYAPFRNMQAADGSLIDMNTKSLNFKLTNPVNIEVQPSYDGTVNLILNDDINPPRIINSRFTTIEDKRFKIIDRNGDNDTNVYKEETFDLETRLFKNSHSIPFVDFLGLQEGGSLKAGLYTFYFKYIDADGNESDIIAESGIVPVHEGGINDPSSISGGILNTNADKIIKLKISNLDTSNDYLNVYYMRSSGEDTFGRIDEFIKITDKKIINGSDLEITITGFENVVVVNNDALNIDYNIVNKVKTQTQVQNMLFFGNVDKPEIPYKDLTDLSLRVIPSVVNEKNIGYLNDSYSSFGGDPEKCEYYNMKNVYYYTGYWNMEIYRLGMVYILKDDSLSPVFNIRGCDNLGMAGVTMNESIPFTRVDSNGKTVRNYIQLSEDGFLPQGTAQFENTKGVVRLRADNEILKLETDFKGTYPLGLGFKISDEVLEEIKKFAKGFFFVRQKRMPTILAQGLTIGVDKESNLPCLFDSKGPVMESFMDSSRILTSDFNRHRIDPEKYGKNSYFKGILSPEITVNKRTYTGVFNNSELVLSNGFFDNANDVVHESTQYRFGISTYTNTKPFSKTYSKNKMTYVGDSTPLKSTGGQYFSTVAGMAEDATKVKYFGIKNKESNAVNLVRGLFGPFIGCENELPPHKIVNIHIPGYSQGLMKEYFKVRFNTLSSYYSIGNRYDVSIIDNYDNISDTTDGRIITEYRGDCFINTVTTRIHRNFQDPDLPLNNEILQVNTWKDNYKSPTDSESKKDTSKINRGDVNAVELGHFVTFKVCSTLNLALRSVDTNYSSEMALLGKPRGFYPVQALSRKAESKMPESELYNIGFSLTTPSKQYMELPDVPYLKNIFDNRIMFSQRHINDAFQNGYRVFQGLQYQDITRQYGAIMKLIDWQGNLLIVFENGIALLPINEKALIPTESGQSIGLYGAGVLPEKESPVSIDYGSRWIESILRTPVGLYGVDTEAKKIWRFSESKGFEIISDFKIGKYLNDHIKFDKDEHYPIIGLRNVKTHFDNFKGDVVFTFYDSTRNDKVDFNLVFNERIDKWITRTSWTPLSSANINNIFVTFDKDKAHDIALDAYTLKDTSISEGIVLDTNVFNSGKIISNKKFGYLYNYLTVEPNAVKKITKSSEWAIPTINQLSDLIARSLNNASNLKESGDIFWNDWVSNSDGLEFGARGGGLRNANGTFEGLKEQVNYWSTSGETLRILNSVISIENNDLKNGNSIRLIKASTSLNPGEWGTYTGNDGKVYKTICIGDNTSKAEWLAEPLCETLFRDGTAIATVTDNTAWSNLLTPAKCSYNNDDLNASGPYPDYYIGELSIKGYEHLKDYTKEYYLEENPGNKFIIKDGNHLYRTVANIPEPLIIKIGVILTKGTMTAPKFTEYLYIKPIESTLTPEQYLYKHGFAALFEDTENPQPLKWYDNPNHKFEFEVIVNDHFQVQKIFNNLKIVSNKTKPDEIQTWIVGDGFEFDVSDYFPNTQEIKDLKQVGRLRGNAHYKENIWDVTLQPFKHKGKEVRLRDKYIKIRVVYSGQDPAIVTALQTFYTISYA